MSRTARTILQIVLALALAGGSGLLLHQWMRQTAPQDAAGQRPATTNVMVAARDLPRGTTLTTDHLTSAPFLPQSLPSGTFPQAEPLLGRVLASSLAANEPVTRQRLTDSGSGDGGVSALIAPGHRAMAVKGNKVMGLAGFVRPGNRVDVLVTLMAGENATRAVTKIVLENVLVLATGQEWQSPQDGAQPASVDVYTLEVTPDQSERLALAASQGTLHFALRNGADTDGVLTQGVDVDAALASLRPAAAPKPRSGPSRARTSVEIITGGERSRVEF